MGRGRHRGREQHQPQRHLPRVDVRFRVSQRGREALRQAAQHSGRQGGGPRFDQGQEDPARGGRGRVKAAERIISFIESTAVQERQSHENEMNAARINKIALNFGDRQVV